MSQPCAAEPAIADAPSHLARPRDPDLADRAFIASSAYHAIRTYFAHAAGLPADDDFDARYRAYLAEALAAPDRRRFSLATMRLFASLRNGHTQFRDEWLREQAPPIPFRIRRLDGAWTVVTSKLPDLHPGDIVATVDGRAADDWLAPIRETIGQSSPSAVDRQVWADPVLLPERFTLGLKDGRELPVDRLAPAPDFERGLVLPSEVVVTDRPEGPRIVRIPGFGHPSLETKAIEAIRGADAGHAVLLDLRGNTGGSTPNRLLAAIMTRPYRGTIFDTPEIIALNDAQTASRTSMPSLMMRSPAQTTLSSSDAWSGRIGVLVDGGCVSACEDFVLRFKEGRRGPVFGEPTLGSTGQPYVQRFPEFGMGFWVSTKRESFPDGSPFEGVGVQPDVPIALTSVDLRSGIDGPLEQAVRLLSGP